jgi:hypothetical protein
MNVRPKATKRGLHKPSVSYLEQRLRGGYT